MRFICGWRTIQPWLKTRCTGALDAGTAKVRITGYSRYWFVVVCLIFLQENQAVCVNVLITVRCSQALRKLFSDCSVSTTCSTAMLSGIVCEQLLPHRRRRHRLTAAMNKRSADYIFSSLDAPSTFSAECCFLPQKLSSQSPSPSPFK